MYLKTSNRFQYFAFAIKQKIKRYNQIKTSIQTIKYKQELTLNYMGCVIERQHQL
jgi:hypothetical protein